MGLYSGQLDVLDDGVKNYCLNAILTIREFLDHAERRLNEPHGHDSYSNADAIEQVTHAMAWGYANASTSLERAIRESDRLRDKEIGALLKAKESP